MRHHHCEQCGVTFDNGAQFMAHICPPGPTKSAYDAVVQELSLAKQDCDSWKRTHLISQDAANGLIADLEAKVAYWEKHHTECHDKWRREFQLRDAPVYVKLDELQAEADKLAAAIERWNKATANNRRNNDELSYETFALECERASAGVDQALAAYAKFKAGGG